jgi:hypothetical protein
VNNLRSIMARAFLALFLPALIVGYEAKAQDCAAEEKSRSEERGVGKGRHVLSPPQHTVTRSATSAPVEPSFPGV